MDEGSSSPAATIPSAGDPGAPAHPPADRSANASSEAFDVKADPMQAFRQRTQPPRSSSAARPLVRLSLDVLASPIGDLHVVCTQSAVCILDFADCQARMRAGLERRYGAYELVRERDPLGASSALERYLGGEIAAVDTLPVTYGGTPFQQRVWTALRTIPAGRTSTYAAIAAQLSGTHARAVGHANSLNPIAVIVPCHRVIGADAGLTGYAGGLPRKAWLLDHEARHAGRSPRFADWW